MKLKLVKFLAKLGVLGLLIGGVGTALLLSGCQGLLPQEDYYKPVLPVELDPEHEMDKK